MELWAILVKLFEISSWGDQLAMLKLRCTGDNHLHQAIIRNIFMKDLRSVFKFRNYIVIMGALNVQLD